MASTNKTTNYELSQFLGTDKPAWLSDYNTDMSKIDAQMKVNADGVTSASGTASAVSTAVGTLANLTTDAKTSVVSAINEVDSHADTAQGTASSALGTATSASQGVTDLATYLNINTFNTYSSTSQFQITQGGGTLRNNTSITVARNSEGSLCKIYGHIVVDESTASLSTIKLNVDTGLRPSERITVNDLGFIENLTSGISISSLTVYINTDGTIEFQGNTTTGSDATSVMRPFACLIFVKNFGDTPEEP